MNSPHDNPEQNYHPPPQMGAEHGMEAIEFALVGALMAVAIIAAIPLLGDSLYSVFEIVMNVINSAAPPGG